MNQAASKPSDLGPSKRLKTFAGACVLASLMVAAWAFSHTLRGPYPEAPRPLEWTFDDAITALSTKPVMDCDGIGRSTEWIEDHHLWALCTFSSHPTDPNAEPGEQAGKHKALARIDARTDKAHGAWLLTNTFERLTLIGVRPEDNGQRRALIFKAENDEGEQTGLMVAIAGVSGWSVAPKLVPGKALRFLGMAWVDGRLEVVFSAHNNRFELEQSQAFEQPPFVFTVGTDGQEQRRSIALDALKDHRSYRNNHVEFLGAYRAEHKTRDTPPRTVWHVLSRGSLKHDAHHNTSELFIITEAGDTISVHGMSQCGLFEGLGRRCVWTDIEHGVLTAPQSKMFQIGESLSLSANAEGNLQYERAVDLISGGLGLQLTRVPVFMPGQRATTSDHWNGINNAMFTAVSPNPNAADGITRTAVGITDIEPEGHRWGHWSLVDFSNLGAGRVRNVGYSTSAHSSFAVVAVPIDNGVAGHKLFFLNQGVHVLALDKALNPARTMGAWTFLSTKGRGTPWEASEPGYAVTMGLIIALPLFFVLVLGFAEATRGRIVLKHTAWTWVAAASVVYLWFVYAASDGLSTLFMSSVFELLHPL